MPLYEYECESCLKRFEKIRKFSDPPLETCDRCGNGPIRKLFSSPAIQFKGSGFYITDYAKKAPTEAGQGGGTTEAGGTKASSPESDSGAKSDSKSDAPSGKPESSSKTDSSSSKSSGPSKSDSSKSETSKSSGDGAAAKTVTKTE